MKNPVTNFEPTNETLPKEWRGVRYTFKNGWTLSVLLSKRGDTHECALFNAQDKLHYMTNFKGEAVDLLYLTSHQVVRLVDYIQQHKDKTWERVNMWVKFEGELNKITS